MVAKRKQDIDDLWEQILYLPHEQQQLLIQKVYHCFPVPLQEKETPSIWDEILSINESISEEDLDKLPHDGSINYKHYLYGHPKEEIE